MLEYKLRTLQSLVFHYTQATNKIQKYKLLIIIYENKYDWFPQQQNYNPLSDVFGLCVWVFFTNRGRKKKEHLIHSFHVCSAAPSLLTSKQRYYIVSHYKCQLDFIGNSCSCWKHTYFLFLGSPPDEVT